MSRKSFGIFCSAALFLLLVGCRCPKEIQTVIDTTAVHDSTAAAVHDTLFIIQNVHDTVEKYIHDTTLLSDIKHDSVDRCVEKSTYVDSNGVWHEDRTEHVTHYIYRESNTYKAKESEYKRTIAELEQRYASTVSEYEHKVSEMEKQLQEKKTVVEVEKRLAWWQKGLMWLGAASIICFIGFVVWKTRSRWKK